MAIGHDRFKEEIELMTGRRMKSLKVGLPVGWRKKNDVIQSVLDPDYTMVGKNCRQIFALSSNRTSQKYKRVAS